MFRKKLVSYALVMVMALSMVACNSKDNTKATDGNTEEVASSSQAEGGSEETTTEPFNKIDASTLVWSDYVTIGEYKGIEVEVPSVEVTEEEIEEKVQSLLSYYAKINEITEGTVADGQTVNIDYTGYINDVQFDGGTATGASLTIGSNSFIDGFEAGLIGVNVGETVTLNLKFPDPYLNNPDYAGKDVVFKVKVNSIQEIVKPELNDEFIATNTTYTTVDEYKASVKENLKTTKEEELKSDKLNDVWTKIIDNCEVVAYPEDLVNQYKEEMNDYYTQIATNYFSSTLEDYVVANGSSMEEFNTTIDEYGKSSAISELVAIAIAEKENIEVSDDELKEYVDSLLEEGSVSGFETAEEIIDYYGESYLKLSLKFQKVLEYVEEQAVEVTAK